MPTDFSDLFKNHQTDRQSHSEVNSDIFCKLVVNAPKKKPWCSLGFFSPEEETIYFSETFVPAYELTWR